MAMATRTVKVSNISLDATEQDLKEFLTFPGTIQHIEMKSENESSKVAYVTFSNSEGAETAALLSGAVLAGQPITITLAPDYPVPASAESTSSAARDTTNTNAVTPESGLRKAEDVVTTMLAKGFILGQDVLNRAKALDEKHRFTSTATSTVASLDQKVGLSEKISAGTILVNDKVKEMDEKYQVSEKTKSAITAAEQSLSNAGSTIMKNRHVLTAATWVTGAYSVVAKAAEEVGQKTREKVLAQENQEKTEENAHTIMPGPPQHATTPNPPSEHESHSQQATTADKPSEPATTQGLVL